VIRKFAGFSSKNVHKTPQGNSAKGIQMAKRIIILIPARMASTRLPGKPLADIAGEPMIVHVWRRAMEANIGDVVVAAGEEEIAAAIRDAGGKALVTRGAHESGSDRIYETLEQVEADKKYDIVVNLQGDLPVIAPLAIARCIDPLEDPVVDIATLGTIITDTAEITNPNVVKIIPPQSGGEITSSSIVQAKDFARLLPPDFVGTAIHHIGIYAYRRTAIKTFVALPQCAREVQMRLEQLRALDAAMRIDAAMVEEVPLGVDTLEDLEKARLLLRKS
jgi:3-deoxy-manno-octulosonate cytidylyltransferase (CMP-KDO synthetase)